MDKQNEYLKTGSLLHGNHIYRITKVLGQGGFGITYLATSEIMDGNIPHEAYYTIKEFFMSDICVRQGDGSISATVTSKPNMEECKKEFLKEAERLRDIGHHEGIVPVNEVISENNSVYYVMEYLGDKSLTKYVAELGGKLGEQEATSIIVSIAKALRSLHDNNLTHLDVKPDNVMMFEKSNGFIPVLIDFGLAKHYNKKGNPTTKVGTLGCSEGYSPLEQYSGINKFSPEADIYALGATFFYLLTGKRPSKASDIDGNYIYENLPKDLNFQCKQTIIKSMQKLAEKRFHTIDEFLLSLDFEPSTVLSDPISGGKTVRINPNGLSFDPKKLIIVVLAVVAVIAVVVLAFVLFPRKKDPSLHADYFKTLTKIERLIDFNGEGALDSVNRADSLLPALQLMEEKYSVSRPHSDSLGKRIVFVRDSLKNLNLDSKDNGAQKTNDVKNQETTTSQSANVSSSASQPVKTEEVQSTSGEVDLGYASYSGSLKNGKPDGYGTLRFRRSHAVDSYDQDDVAESGDRISGTFRNGHLESGKWRKSSGEVQTLMIGSN